jgi:hypothetical protein
MWDKNMPNIENQVLKNFIKSLVIGQAVRIAASNCIGITKIDVLIYPYRATLRLPYKNSNIQHQHVLKMHHTYGASPYIAPKQNTLRNTKTAL